MKMECRPDLGVKVTLTLDVEEVRQLNTLSSYGTAVVEPIVGKLAGNHILDPWEKFLSDIRAITAGVLRAYDDAQAVFVGHKAAVDPRRLAHMPPLKIDDPPVEQP